MNECKNLVYLSQPKLRFFFANASGHSQGAEILTGQATFLRAVSKRQFFARERHLHPLSTYIWVGQAIFIVNLVILWLNRVICA